MNKELLQKFMSSSCSEAEQEYVYRWICDLMSKDEVSALMKNSWDNMSDEIDDEFYDKKASIINTILKYNDDRPFQQDSNKFISPFTARNLKRNGKWSILKSAALVVFLTGLFFLVDYEEAGLLEEVVFVEKSNPDGRKSTIRLPDGSMVKLNSGSKIRYASKFNNNLREVILEGEAFFEVKKDKRRPFVVRTSDITTTVLGTSFNVRAYAKLDAIEVAVVRGKVEVKKTAYSNAENESVAYLESTQMAIYQREKRELETASFNKEKITGWKDGILIFENADINEIADKLKKWYGMEIEIEGDVEIGAKRYTGKFDNNSLEYVLKAISYTSCIDFTMNDNKVVLKQKSNMKYTI